MKKITNYFCSLFKKIKINFDFTFIHPGQTVNKFIEHITGIKPEQL